MIAKELQSVQGCRSFVIMEYVSLFGWADAPAAPNATTGSTSWSTVRTSCGSPRRARGDRRDGAVPRLR